MLQRQMLQRQVQPRRLPLLTCGSAVGQGRQGAAGLLMLRFWWGAGAGAAAVGVPQEGLSLAFMVRSAYRYREWYFWRAANGPILKTVN